MQDRTVRRRLDTLERITATQPAAVDIWRSPEWQAIQTVLVEELAAYPEVRVKIAARLAELGM